VSPSLKDEGRKSHAELRPEVVALLMAALAIFVPYPYPPPVATLFETLKYGFTAGLG
jgi:hypothetical protein